MERNGVEPLLFVEPHHDVHYLEGVSSGPLEEVVDRPNRHDPSPPLVYFEAHVAEVGAYDHLRVGEEEGALPVLDQTEVRLGRVEGLRDLESVHVRDMSSI